MSGEVTYKADALNFYGINKVGCNRMFNIVNYSKSERILRQYIHTCPICEKKHFVNEARHRVAYGKHYTCSLECEKIRRKSWWHFT